MPELVIEATVENLEKVRQFIDENLENFGCKMKSQLQIDLAVEELFVNIASYAYTPGKGMATIQISESDGNVTITFIDSGRPFNPLEHPDPDITLSAEEREIGGLGIYMVKKGMDNVSYSYTDNQNILSVVKSLR